MAIVMPTIISSLERALPFSPGSRPQDAPGQRADRGATDHDFGAAQLL
jgi:hypothetical protein